MANDSAAALVPALPAPAVSVGVIWVTVLACLAGILAAALFLAARPNPEVVPGAKQVPDSAAATLPAPRPAPTRTAAPTTGEILYQNSGCTTCHGDSGEGTRFAPALSAANLSGRFSDVAILASYLRDPNAPPFDTAPLWTALRAKFPEQPMQPSTLDDADLIALAHYLRERIGQ